VEIRPASASRAQTDRMSVMQLFCLWSGERPRMPLRQHVHWRPTASSHHLHVQVHGKLDSDLWRILQNQSLQLFRRCGQQWMETRLLVGLLCRLRRSYPPGLQLWRQFDDRSCVPQRLCSARIRFGRYPIGKQYVWQLLWAAMIVELTPGGLSACFCGNSIGSAPRISTSLCNVPCVGKLVTPVGWMPFPN
jgi:hypothetical protein